MTTYRRLLAIQQQKRTRLCIGLDPRPELLPQAVHGNVELFLKRIIEATLEHSCAYKLNLAYFEQLGSAGFRILEALLDFFRTLPDTPILIADAKRSDVPHTATVYAHTYLHRFAFDAITINPLLGTDSLLPFLEFTEKLVFILALTSNPGAADFLLLQCQHRSLFEYILEHTAHLAPPEQIGYVVGATHPHLLHTVRQQYPDSFLLIPGIGAQGGHLQTVRELNGNHPALFAVSRSVLYASTAADFATAAQKAAAQLHQLSW